MKITFTELQKENLNYLLEKEFLITNGLGSFVSSTICGMNTRKYHGLLVSALNPPVKHHLLFSRIDETITIDNVEYQLDTNQWKEEVIAPQGYKHLSEFSIDPYPIWIYKIGEVTLTKQIILFYGQDIVQINYKVEGNKSPCRLKLNFLVNHRDYHKVTKGESSWYFKQKQEENSIILQAFVGATPLCINWSKGEYKQTEVWFYNYFYQEDKKRGLEYIEDNYNPGSLRVFLNDGEDITITASTKKIENIPPFEEAKDVLLYRLNKVLDYSMINYEQVAKEDVITLIYAADQFLVKRNSTSSKSVIAGYHWFSDWGRDAMISFSGLTLVTKRFNEAKSILKTFSTYINEGLIPNRFEDSSNNPEYNTADATLWLFQAVLKYLEYTEDDDFIYNNVYSQLKSIIEWHKHGTKFNIKLDQTDGLISGGNDQDQLTWMDAKVDERAITPRSGKPIEINMLWYNALRIMELLAKRYKEDSYSYKILADQVKESIETKFWNEEDKCLYDFIDYNGVCNKKLRPNQIFALSLPYTIFSKDKEKLILKTIEEKLLTPYGLKSLSSEDSDYKGIYEGNTLLRDESYHQGTVWSWLLGPFVTAFLRIESRNETNIHKAKAMLQPLLKHTRENACIGSISEIFDGNEPYKPRGCIAQAWSVSEVLRCLIEDIYDLKPPKLKSDSNYILSKM